MCKRPYEKFKSKLFGRISQFQEATFVSLCLGGRERSIARVAPPPVLPLDRAYTCTVKMHRNW